MTAEAAPENYALIAHPTEPRALLLAAGDAWALPRIGSDEPAEIIAQIRARLGLETTVLGLIYQGLAADHRQGHAPADAAAAPNRVYALEPRAPAEWQPPAGARWIASKELAALPLGAEAHHAVIADWLHEIEAQAVPQERPQWARPGWRHAALAWADKRATERGYQLTAPPEQVKVSLWSAVYRVPAEPVALYFKAAAPMFAYEAAVTRVLSERLGAWVPRVIAADAAHGWLLIEDGGSLLRERVETQDGQRRFEEALGALAAMQQASAPYVAELLAAGCPDYRLETLPAHYAALVADRETLQVGRPGGVPEDEYVALAALGLEVERICARLAESGIPATVHHDDLGPGNVLESPDGRLLLFDWGECGVAHPFCSLMIPLRWARLVLDYDEAALQRTREAYLSAWSAFGPPEHLREALALAHRLAYLCRTLTYARLRPQLEPRRWGEYADVVPYWLRLFLRDAEPGGDVA
ncbi:MAG TPA: aminoglycoside phosphotransferase family protein [Ktedonobacterales bacterium]|nr:aminoglycoside phosphotransferase family protein [Ktedonobacterales bacterium]